MGFFMLWKNKLKIIAGFMLIFLLPAATYSQTEDDIDRATKEVDRSYRKEAQKEIEAIRGKPDIEAGEKEIAFTVVLVDYGRRKLKVIRKIRDLMHLSLKESRDLVENVPCDLKSGFPEEEAENIKEELEDTGATVKLKTVIIEKP